MSAPVEESVASSILLGGMFKELRVRYPQIPKEPGPAKKFLKELMNEQAKIAKSAKAEQGRLATLHALL